MFIYEKVLKIFRNKVLAGFASEERGGFAREQGLTIKTGFYLLHHILQCFDKRV